MFDVVFLLIDSYIFLIIIESTVTSVMSTCLFDLYIMIQFCGSQPISLTKSINDDYRGCLC